MSYLRVSEFWEYQNADAWKKALAAKKSDRRYPTWCKLVVRRDREMDALPLPTRLLYLELLRLAVEHTNVILNDSEWIAKQISIPPEDVTKGVRELLEGAWIQETQSARLSRNFLENFASRSRSRSRTPLPPKPSSREPNSNGKPICPECGVGLIVPLAEHLERIHDGKGLA